MKDIFDVVLSKRALKDVKSVPTHIVIKLQAWIEMVGTCGLNSISEVPGYRNEALQGKRKGQYSIRLN